MKTLADLAEALSAARQVQNLTIKDLAARAGMTPLAVSQALEGKSALRAQNLMALADALGLELLLVPKVVAQSMGGFKITGEVLPSQGKVMQNADGSITIRTDEFIPAHALAAQTFMSPMQRAMEKLNSAAPGAKRRVPMRTLESLTAEYMQPVSDAKAKDDKK